MGIDFICSKSLDFDDFSSSPRTQISIDSEYDDDNDDETITLHSFGNVSTIPFDDAIISESSNDATLARSSKRPCKDDDNHRENKKRLFDKYDEEEQFQLGCDYFYAGVPRKHAQAVKYFEKAANQLHVGALHYMGICYLNGNGMEKDSKKAFEIFHKAADQGHTLSQRRVGLCYECGSGVEPDLKWAFYWYQKAAFEGDAVAQHRMGRFYALGKYVTRNLAEAEKWLKRAADAGETRASVDLKNLKSYSSKNRKKQKSKSYQSSWSPELLTGYGKEIFF